MQEFILKTGVKNKMYGNFLQELSCWGAFLVVVFGLLGFCCWLLVRVFCGLIILLGFLLLVCLFCCCFDFFFLVKFTEKNSKMEFSEERRFFLHPAPATSFLPM